MLFGIFNFIFLNSFFFNFLMLFLFCFFFINFILKGKFEFQNLYLNFILYINITENNKNYLILIKNIVTIESLNLFFINLYDLILDFLDYFLFFFSVYFIYPEILFWYAYIINKFTIEQSSWFRINYDIVNNEFYSRKNHKNTYIFHKLRKRWLIDHRYFIIIYSLYFKILVRFIYFFIYFIFLTLFHYFKKFIGVFYFYTFANDLISYIYIYTLFYLKKYINISLIRKFYIYLDYLKYEFIYFFYNLPFFFYFYSFIIFLNNLSFKTFSFLNVYRFKKGTTGHSIPENYSLPLFDKIIPLIYISKLNIFRYFSFIFIFFKYFLVILFLFIMKIINNSTLIYIFHIIIFNFVKQIKLIVLFVSFICFTLFFYEYINIIFIFLFIFYLLYKCYINIYNIYIFIGFYFFCIVNFIFVFLKTCIYTLFFLVKKIRYIFFFLFFCFFILYCDWNLMSVIGVSFFFEKINIFFDYWFYFLYHDVYFDYLWSWSLNYKLYINEQIQNFFIYYFDFLNKQQHILAYYYRDLSIYYSLFKILISDLISFKVNPWQLYVNYELFIRQTNFGVIFKILIVYLNIIYINLQFYFFIYVMPFLFLHASNYNYFYFFWSLFNWLNLIFINFYYYFIYLFFYWIPFNIIPYFINVYFYVFTLFYKYVIIYNLINNIGFNFFFTLNNILLLIYYYLCNILWFLIFNFLDFINFNNIYNLYLICFFFIYDICLFFFYNITKYLHISYIVYILSLLYINIYIEVHDMLNLLLSWFRIPILHWDLWNNWKKLYISTIFTPEIRRSTMRDYGYTSPVYIFRGDFLIWTNINYFFFFIKILYTNFILIDTFILLDEYFYPFYLRFLKFIIIIYYYLLLLLFNLFFNNKKEVLGNNIFLWEKIKETLTFNTVNDLVSIKENKILKKLQKKKLNKKTLFNKFYFKLFKIKLNNLNKNFNFILNKNFNLLNNNQNLYTNIKQKYIKNIKNIYHINPDNFNISSDLMFNYFSKLNQKFYNEISYYKNEYLNVYFKTYKQNYLYILNNYYVDLLALLRTIHKTDKYIPYFLFAQDTLNEYQYYFVRAYNKNIRENLVNMHKIWTFKILNYFGKIDEVFFNDKGPSWLLHKNTYTLFFNKNTADIEVILSQKTVLFTRSFFWKLLLPFFLLIFIYFQSFNYSTFFLQDLKLYYIFLFMFLDNYDLFFTINTYILQPITFIQRSPWSECSYANRSELKEFGKLIFSSKYQFILNLYEYKNLYYFNNKWNFINIIKHPFIFSCSWELNKIYIVQVICLICIVFIFFLKNLFLTSNLNFIKIDKTKVQIKNKVIIAIYKHYDFIFNKKKSIYKNNIKL